MWTMRQSTVALAIVAAATLVLPMPPASVVAAEPAVAIVDDYVAGSMDFTLSGALKVKRTMDLRVGSRTNTSIEFQYSTKQTLQGTWGSVQLIVPVVPGSYPLSPDAFDEEAGIGYLWWHMQGVPDPGAGCQVTWAEVDGAANGRISCPPMKSGVGKKTFRFAANFVAIAVEAGRSCLPGYLPAPIAPSASPAPGASPGPSAAPIESSSPSAPPIESGPPSAATIWATLASPPTCVPETPITSPEPSQAPVVEACSLLSVDEVSEALGAAATALTVDRSVDGRCGYLDTDGYGVMTVVTRGVNILPPRALAGVSCQSVDFDYLGDRAFAGDCTDPGYAWSVGVDGAVKGVDGVTVLIAYPTVPLGILSTRVEDLLTLAFGRLP